MSALASRPFLDQRRALVAVDRQLAGLDHLVATRLDETTWRLALHFLTSPEKPAPVPSELARRNLRLLSSGGERLRQPSIVGISPAQGGVVEVMVRFRDVRQAELAVAAGPVELELVGLPEVDPFFRQVSFSFAAEPSVSEEPGEANEPRFAAARDPKWQLGAGDTMARDYDSLRLLMENHMAARVPAWTERNPADLGVTILEILAYAGDYLAYFQDSVATEAYLETALHRPSVRRHARLIDYHLDEGSNARVWVRIELDGEGPLELARGSQLVTRTGDLGPVVAAGGELEDQALGAGTVIFETLFPQTLDPGKNRFEIYTWGATELTLPSGATSLALAGHFPALAAGEVLLIAPTDLVDVETTSAEAEHSRMRRVVRLKRPPVLGVDPATGEPYTRIDWFPADALEVPLPVASQRRQGLAAVYGNLVLADEGRSVLELLPPVPFDRHARNHWAPELGRPGLTFRALSDPEWLRRLPARAALIERPEMVLPAVSLLETPEDCLVPASEMLEVTRLGPPGQRWLPRVDLLSSDRFAHVFVVEMSELRRARLRFGDGVHGRRPQPGCRFQAYYRIGGGPSGNVAAGTIAHLATTDPALLERVRAVSNPIPAQGGRNWEPLENARLLAPTAFHTQRRCVIREDFERAAETHPEVRSAAARLRWTGGQNTAFVYLQRQAGKPPDTAFFAEVEALLRPLMVADVDLALRPPHWAPLGLAFTVTYQAELDPRLMRHRLEDALSDRLLPGGGSGFFYPDNMSFGAPIYASDLISRLMAVSGVLAVVVDRFERLDVVEDESLAGGRSHALARGYLEFGPLEIAMLANRPASPELGMLEFVLEARR